MFSESALNVPLQDTKKFLSKEINLLNSITGQFEAAVKQGGGGGVGATEVGHRTHSNPFQGILEECFRNSTKGIVKEYLRNFKD
jgi:hypothetical protein